MNEKYDYMKMTNYEDKWEKCRKKVKEKKYYLPIKPMVKNTNKTKRKEWLVHFILQ